MTPDEIETLHNAVQSWTSPVWFNQGLAALPETVEDNGSCGFVRSGDSRFLVTAHHVLEGFRSAKRLHADAVFAVNIGDGNTVALAEPNVIAEAADLDLATIEFPDLDRDPARTSKNYFPLDRWPPRRARAGEAVTIVGFPGQERRAFETFGAFEPVPIGMVVTTVSDRRIGLVDENNGVRIVREGRHLEEGVALGGLGRHRGFCV